MQEDNNNNISYTTYHTCCNTLDANAAYCRLYIISFFLRIPNYSIVICCVLLFYSHIEIYKYYLLLIL